MISTLTCMAVAVYFEARGEPIDGQLLVAEVIMNRALDERWPDEPCAVIAQPHQFSFYRDGRPNRPRDMEAYTTAVLVAKEAWEGKHLETGALWFHSTTVRPVWRHNYQPIGTVGGHVFYVDRELAPSESPRPVMRPQGRIGDE
jgi:spore germination cell wall hydrolase CwlJ-like protein